MHRSLHPILHPRSGLGPPGQTSFYPASLHRPSCAHCLSTLDLIPGSLSSPAAQCHKPVSFVLSPVRSPPFTSLGVTSAPVKPCGFSLLCSQTIPPHSDLNRGPIPSSPEGGCASIPGVLSSYFVLPLHSLFFALYIDVFGELLS